MDAGALRSACGRQIQPPRRPRLYGLRNVLPAQGGQHRVLVGIQTGGISHTPSRRNIFSGCLCHCVNDEFHAALTVAGAVQVRAFESPS